MANNVPTGVQRAIDWSEVTASANVRFHKETGHPKTAAALDEAAQKHKEGLEKCKELFSDFTALSQARRSSDDQKANELREQIKGKLGDLHQRKADVIESDERGRSKETSARRQVAVKDAAKDVTIVAAYVAKDVAIDTAIGFGVPAPFTTPLGAAAGLVEGVYDGVKAAKENREERNQDRSDLRDRLFREEARKRGYDND